MTGEATHGDSESRLRSIHVRYRLPIDAKTDRATIERVLGFHAKHCQIYRSLHPQIEISTELELLTESD